MNAEDLTAQYIASRQPRRPTRWERILNWLDIWSPRAGILALAITLAALIYLVPTLDSMAREAMRSCGL